MSDALVLIDIQNDYFPGGKMELVGIEQAAKNARGLLQEFKRRERLVVHIQHISTHPGATFFLPGTSGAETNLTVSPEKGEPVITKHYPNAFRETSLLEVLRAARIEGLTICGAMSHMCVDASVRAAFDLGFRCIVAEDACATRDLVFRDRTVKAADVHAAFMAALSARYASVVLTREILENRA
jgi:nicotinamidase-related amidase